MNRMLHAVLVSVMCISPTCGDEPSRAELGITQPSKDFVVAYVRAGKKGYIPRPCGFDMNRNGVRDRDGSGGVWD